MKSVYRVGISLPGWLASPSAWVSSSSTQWGGCQPGEPVAGNLHTKTPALLLSCDLAFVLGSLFIFGSTVFNPTMACIHASSAAEGPTGCPIPVMGCLLFCVGHPFKPDHLPFPVPHRFEQIPPRAQCLFMYVQLIINIKVNRQFRTEYLYKVGP